MFYFILDWGLLIVQKFIANQNYFCLNPWFKKNRSLLFEACKELIFGHRFAKCWKYFLHSETLSFL